MTINFMKYRTLWLSLSVVVTVLALVFFAVWGLKYNIDFTGGGLLEIKFIQERPNIEEVRSVVTSIDNSISVQDSGDNNVIFRFQKADEAMHQNVVTELRNKYTDKFQEERFESVGPSVGKELKTKAFYSIILAMIAIVLYIAYAFRKVSYPVASWKYGLFAILALIHDVLLVVGVFAVLGKFMGIDVGLPFVAALLTVLGYSVNDTIVVFDRVRENLGRISKISFTDLVNRSVNETLARSINTTLTTLLALIAIFFWGGVTIKFFALALIIGIFSGAYSSIFIACPLLILAHRKKQ
ncbi:MAG: Protein translocase subunit SecF [Parcubacteria group bacterium GW2011_GWC2_39_14]|nr:MAG: Protein translocase subunit SecF [Parcubacteria group bacterium GW2011_GWC2_39_14]KKR54877.1 MAG: Protein translocase subunit SecF [Parcubacteria group bacterium GW2011_GWA2_40_23]